LDPAGCTAAAGVVGTGIDGDGPARRPEVMAIAAVEAVFHHLTINSCCQTNIQKNAAAKTTHTICKSRGRLIAHSRPAVVGNTSSTILIVLVNLDIESLGRLILAEML
jgi:hypothetical protein